MVWAHFSCLKGVHGRRTINCLVGVSFLHVFESLNVTFLTLTWIIAGLHTGKFQLIFHTHQVLILPLIGNTYGEFRFIFICHQWVSLCSSFSFMKCTCHSSTPHCITFVKHIDALISQFKLVLLFFSCLLLSSRVVPLFYINFDFMTINICFVPLYW